MTTPDDDTDDVEADSMGETQKNLTADLEAEFVAKLLADFTRQLQ